jgi:hypothetical protein
MKKTISTIAILTIGYLTVQLNIGYGQTMIYKRDIISPETLTTAVKLNDPSNYERTEAKSLNEVNTKALRYFKKQYKDINNEKWYTLTNGYLAEFNGSSSNNLVVYDKKGNWKFTISYYDEKNLPPEIRSIVKPVYYDYTISRVEEIHVDDKIIYLVHIQNETSLKTVRVCNGEMELMEEFNKQ